MAKQPKWQSFTPQEVVDRVQSAAPHSQIVELRVRQGLFELISLEAAKDLLEKLTTSQQFEKAENTLGIRTDFATALKVSDAAKPEEPVGAVVLRFSIVTTYVFNPEAKVDSDSQTVFAKVQSIMHSWPYWREFTQSALSRLGMQSRVAPLVLLPQAIAMAGFRAVAPNPPRKKVKAQRA